MVLFPDSEGPWPGLSFDIDDLTMNVHFLDSNWIEIDTYRTKITPDRFDALLALMRRVGDSLERDVFVTPELNLADAAVVYEVAKRAFRAPRHGTGSDGRVRRQLFDALTPMLQAILDRDSRPLHAPRSLATLQLELKQVDDALATFGELTLQDHITIDDRCVVDHFRALLATLVRDTADSRTPNRLAAGERALSEAASRLQSTAASPLRVAPHPSW